MLRVIIDLVPAGVGELAMPVDEFYIACKLPLNPASQSMHVFHRGRYALIEGYNGNEAAGGYAELVLQALRVLKYRSVTLKGNELFPGTLALAPDEFDAQMAGLVEQAGQYIHSIRLFGRRAREDVTPATFRARLDALLKDTAGQQTVGDLIFGEYPGYIVYDLAVRLFRKHYQSEPVTVGPLTYPSRGELLEDALTAAFCLRPFPWAPQMRCANGLRLLFVRPSDEIATHLTRDMWLSGSTVLTSEASDPKLWRDLHADIRAGRIIYDARGGLRKYPGAAPFGRADVLPEPADAPDASELTEGLRQRLHVRAAERPALPDAT